MINYSVQTSTSYLFVCSEDLFSVPILHAGCTLLPAISHRLAVFSCADRVWPKLERELLLEP